MQSSHITTETGGKIPRQSTKSFNIFCAELSENLFLLNYLLTLDQFVDNDTKQKALKTHIENIKGLKLNVSKQFIRSTLQEVKLSFQDVSYYERILGHMTFCKFIDNFLCYLKDVLVEVINKEPNILKSSKDTENLEDILSFNSIDDLRKFIIEKKMRTLFYKGLEDVEKFFNHRLGLSLFEDQGRDINKLIKRRNIIVHNRGKINDEIIELEPELKEFKGQDLEIHFQFEELYNISQLLNNMAVDIDVKLAKKFKLKTYKNKI